MAKAIKFNLQIDGKPVRTIDELRDNYNVQDILEAYKNQNLLIKWLDIRGYENELDKVKAINTQNDMEISRQLISIFDIDINEDEIRCVLYNIFFHQQKESKLENIREKDMKLNELISKYHQEYNELKEQIKNNAEDYPFLKEAASKIQNDYFLLFSLDYKNLFTSLKNDYPLPILAFVANKKLRTVIMKDDIISELLGNYVSSNYSGGFYLGKTVFTENSYLRKYLQVFTKDTDDVWMNIESKDKEYLILHIDRATYVRSADKDEELTCDAINNKFVITTGIDYKSMYCSSLNKRNIHSKSKGNKSRANSSPNKILYMEI